MDPFVISIAVFLAVAALVGGVAFVMSSGASKAEDRLEIMIG